MKMSSESHAIMCAVGSSGACFVPWCTCECHTPLARVPVVTVVADPLLTPERLREAAATMDAFWQSTGREYDPDVLREEADQIESETSHKQEEVER
jgi:hypothetical protein